MANSNLTSAKKAKNDEFYTQMSDIAKELNHYRDHLKDKVILCNCDDPFESNFFRFFAENFNALGIKRLIATSYKPSPIANTQLGLFGDDKTLEPKKGRPKVTANVFIVSEVRDINGDGAIDRRDIAEKLKANKNNEWRPLEGDGDFRSAECVEFLKQADIVITNPPFSLFYDYVRQLVDYKKQFLIIGGLNSITYKDIFKLIKENKIWLGYNNGAKTYQVPEYYEQKNTFLGADGKRYAQMGNTGWYTNLDTKKRHEEIPLYKTYTPEAYPTYDNYDAIEVDKANEIPKDYDGMMGVPVTFLVKYNPNQFEILGYEKSYVLQKKKYPTQIQVDKNGKKSNVTKLNDGAAIKVPNPPIDKTYYIVDGEYYIQAFKRIFIKRRN